MPCTVFLKSNSPLSRILTGRICGWALTKPTSQLFKRVMGRVSTARARLVQGTIDLIWTESYGSVTVDAICERARVKKGSFYHFFRSKDELVIAALDAHWEARKPTLDNLFAPPRPPL